jgi:hypothetical protein
MTRKGRFANDAVTAPEVETTPGGKMIVRGIYRSRRIPMPEIGDEVVVESCETRKKERGFVIDVNLIEGTYDVEIQR